MTTARPQWYDYALLVLLALVWGSTFLFIKIAVATLPPASLTALRMIVAAAVLLPLAIWAGERLPGDLRTWVLIAIVSLTGTAIPFTLISWGEERIDSGLAAILMGAAPLYTLVLAHFFTTDEPLTMAKLIGVLIGLAGLLFLVGPVAFSHAGDDSIRQLAIAGAALSYAVNAVMTKSLLALPRLAAASAIMLASVVVMVPIALVLEQPWSLSPTGPAIASALLLGMLHTGFATLLMMKLLARRGAGFFGQINLLVPLFGVLWGVIFLSERPSADHLVALALILAGVAIAGGISGMFPARKRL